MNCADMSTQSFCSPTTVETHDEIVVNRSTYGNRWCTNGLRFRSLTEEFERIVDGCDHRGQIRRSDLVVPHIAADDLGNQFFEIRLLGFHQVLNVLFMPWVRGNIPQYDPNPFGASLASARVLTVLA